MAGKIKPGYNKITIVIKTSTHNKFKKHVKKEGSNITEHLNRLIKNDLK